MEPRRRNRQVNIIKIDLKELSNQPPLEKGQSIVRTLNGLIFLTYLLGMYLAGWEDEVRVALPYGLAYLTFGLVMVVLTRHSPGFSIKRCLSSIVLDQLLVAAMISGSGMIGVPFAFSPSVATIGYSLRYGASFAYFSCAVSFVFMTTGVYFSDFWNTKPFFAVGIVLTACWQPVYAAVLSTRLAKEKREFEVKAAEMEGLAKKSQKQLREHQAELAHVARLSTMGEMASGIAHEINQPLTAILSYNQACIRMLKDEEFDSEEVMRAMNMAAGQAKRAGEIITRLRSFVKKQPTSSSQVNINQVVTDSLFLVDHVLRDSQVAVHTDFQHPMPQIAADSIQLEQVILNLIRNAIDAMADAAVTDRRIWVSTRHIDDTVHIDVRDNGPGIPEEVLPQLFHPFFTTKVKGMGLGLTISQSIIEAFEGKISARNADTGGAIFSLSLPVLQTKKDAVDVEAMNA